MVNPSVSLLAKTYRQAIYYTGMQNSFSMYIKGGKAAQAIQRLNQFRE